jgi:hypothetical protein
MSIQLPQDPIPFRGDVVRIAIPARAAFELDSLTKVVRNVAELLGCPECFSGANCYFELQRQFLVDPADLSVRPSFEAFRH